MKKTRNSKFGTRNSVGAPPLRSKGGTIEIPKGFRFSAASCGLKKKPGALDLALIVSDAPASAAAVFTTNRVKAEPVLRSQAHLKHRASEMRAILINSGNANCCTGSHGRVAAAVTAIKASIELDCMPSQVLTCSTGVIGVPLPFKLVRDAIPSLVQSLSAKPRSFHSVTRAIMTTDTRPKWAAASCRIAGRTVRLLGCTKGAGMIAPNMATMLAFIVTDAAIAPPLLQRALREAVGHTFNRITVDGDTSTNDTVALLASGASGARVAPGFSPAFRSFATALEKVCRSLALQIVADGEGAQRVVEIEVRGAKSERDAEQVARTIANSPLVKTALAGADPNWGRILAAAGRAGVAFDPDRAHVWMAGIKVYSRGRALPFDERAAHRRLLAPYISIVVDLDSRPARHSAVVWTCDFTAAYVDINASYRT